MKNFLRNVYKILNESKLPKEDKLKHFFVGDYIAFITFAVLSAVLLFFKLNLYWYCLLPIPALFAGYMKEYLDKKYSLGNSEKMDFFYTVKPSLQYTIIILTLILTLKNS